MQLKRLYIKDYKILKDFTIEFPYDYKKYISVFIGANGSGKSTILEAIAEIFSGLFLQQTPKFDFEIEYSVKKISDKSWKYPHSGVSSDNLMIKISGKKGEPYLIKEKADNGYKSFGLNNTYALPSNIVIYYSGLSEIMEEICKPHDERLSKAYRKGNTRINRDFFYFRPEHFNIILLSLLSFEYGDIPDFLREKAKIDGLQNIQIVLKEPYWADSGSVISDFWGASGTIRRFLDFICHDYSDEEQKYEFLDYNLIKSNITVEEIDYDKLLIKINGHNTLYAIKEFLGEEKSLFDVLGTMYYDDLLDKIQITLIKIENETPIPFTVLSEGEQQAITIRGLTELLGTENTLFLLDEPDTYLHPEWQRQFIPEIQSTIKETINSENFYMIATHSPNIVSVVERDSLFILEEGNVKEIPFNSYGKNIESLLIDFFNVDGVRNKYVEKLLKEVQEIVKNRQLDSPEFKAKFQELKDILGPTAPEVININLEIAKSRKK